MGILDDAIREHLELKRRHGADNQEVSRQEREILGGGEPDLSEPAGLQEPVLGETAAYDVVEPAYLDPEPVAELPLDDLPAGDPPPPLPPLPVEPLAGPASTDATPPPAPTRPVDDLFPGTGELLAAASETPAPAPAASSPSRPLAAPAPADADSETAARSGARRLSDDELAAWRRRLSERADRLAAQRPGADAPAPSGGAAGLDVPAKPSPAATRSEPPAYWSGNTTGADVGTPPATPAGGQRAAAPVPEPEPPVSGIPVDFFDAGDAAASAFAPEAAPEPEVPDHDVLDETPEFLEETPEHDRMWFEQRPPRDFDFG